MKISRKKQDVTYAPTNVTSRFPQGQASISQGAHTTVKGKRTSQRNTYSKKLFILDVYLEVTSRTVCVYSMLFVLKYN